MAQKEWKFEPYPLSGSFAEQRWEFFRRNPEGFLDHYGQEVYDAYAEEARKDYLKYLDEAYGMNGVLYEARRRAEEL